jgi:hypothetical protein
MMSLLEALILFMNMGSDSYIRKYCLEKFQSNYRLSSDDTELVVPSIFIDNDYKRHMSINIDTGLWRCFKTGEVGNFLKLYAILEKCSYREAYEKFVFEDFMAGYKGRRPIEEFDPNQIDSDLDEAENFKVVEDHPFVESRGVGQFKFYVATSGKYRGRLIIPFINRNSTSKGGRLVMNNPNISTAKTLRVHRFYTPLIMALRSLSTSLRASLIALAYRRLALTLRPL